MIEIISLFFYQRLTIFLWTHTFDVGRKYWDYCSCDVD